MLPVSKSHSKERIDTLPRANGSDEPKSTAKTQKKVKAGTEVTSKSKSTIKGDVAGVAYKSERMGESTVKKDIEGTEKEEQHHFSGDTSVFSRTAETTKTVSRKTSSKTSTKITGLGGDGTGQTQSEVEQKIRKALTHALLAATQGGNLTLEATQTAQVVTSAYADLIVAAGASAQSDDDEACARAISETGPQTVSASVSEALAASQDPRFSSQASAAAEKLQAASATVSGSAAAQSCAQMGKSEAQSLLAASAYGETVSSIIEDVLVTASKDATTTTQTSETKTGTAEDQAEVESMTSSDAEGEAIGDSATEGGASTDHPPEGTQTTDLTTTDLSFTAGSALAELDKKLDDTPTTTPRKMYVSAEGDVEPASSKGMEDTVPSSPDKAPLGTRWDRSHESSSTESSSSLLFSDTTASELGSSKKSILPGLGTKFPSMDKKASLLSTFSKPSLLDDKSSAGFAIFGSQDDIFGSSKKEEAPSPLSPSPSPSSPATIKSATAQKPSSKTKKSPEGAETLSPSKAKQVKEFTRTAPVEPTKQLTAKKATSPAATAKKKQRKETLSPQQLPKSSTPRKQCAGNVRSKCCDRQVSRCSCGQHADGQFCIARRMDGVAEMVYQIYKGWGVVDDCQCPTDFIY